MPDALIPFPGNPPGFGSDGALKVTQKPSLYDLLTNAVQPALNSQFAIDVRDVASLMVQLKNTGGTAMAAGVLSFEASINSTDGTNGDWFGVTMARTNANTLEATYTTSAVAAGAVLPFGWEFSASGINWFRVRVSTALTAGSVATLMIQRSSVEVDPGPLVPTHAVTGSGTFTIAPAATATAYSLVGLATTNLVSVVAAATSLLELSVFNPTAAVIYLKLYNKATAPVLATDTPVAVIPVPINGEVSKEYGVLGKRFSAGLAIAITAGPTHTDAVAVAAGVVVHATRI